MFVRVCFLLSDKDARFSTARSCRRTRFGLTLDEDLMLLAVGGDFFCFFADFVFQHFDHARNILHLRLDSGQHLGDSPLCQNTA